MPGVAVASNLLRCRHLPVGAGRLPQCGIGCVDCKKPITDAVVAELEPLQQQARQYEQDPAQVQRIITAGNARPGAAAEQTMQQVRTSMGLQ